MRRFLKFLSNLWHTAKDFVTWLFPGLKGAQQEIGAEFSRLGTQGAMELASALFNGHGFVPYGPGQYTPTPEHDQPPLGTTRATELASALFDDHGSSQYGPGQHLGAPERSSQEMNHGMEMER